MKFKAMNPKRIAGKASKDNYEHNLIEGSEMLTLSCEGRKESNLKRYESVEVAQLKRQLADFKKGGGGIGC